IDRAREDADPPYLPLQLDSRGFQDAPADFLAQAFQIGGRGGAGVDQEVAVLLRDLGAAPAQAAAAGALHELPGAFARRVLEGAAAGAAADRLAFRARLLDLAHAAADRCDVVGMAAQAGGDEDPV